MTTDSVPSQGALALDVIRNLEEFVQAGLLIAGGQLGVKGLEGLSVSAGTLLRDGGVVRTVPEGIVLYHERLAERNKPLGRILRRSDRRAGNLPKRRVTPAQALVREAVRSGGVTRDEKGRITGVTPRVKRILRASKEARDRVKRQLAAKRKKGFLGRLLRGTRRHGQAKRAEEKAIERQLQRGLK